MTGNMIDRKHKVKVLLSITILFLLLSMITTACGGGGSSVIPKCIYLRFDDFTEKGKSTDIYGTVTNDCNKAIAKAKILVTCYDMYKNAVDDDSTSVKDVAAGGTAPFTVTIEATKEQTTNCQPEVTSVDFK